MRAILGKKRPAVTNSGVAMADRDDIFLFAGFRLDRRGGSLFQCGEDGVLTPVPIGPRALDVLGVLVARAGDLVSRDEIIAAAWPEAVVNDNNLNMQIAAIRRVLDDDEAMPSCIQTIPRRGYRFVAPVTRGGPAAQLIPVQPLRPGDQDYAARAVPKSRSRYRAGRAIMAGVVGALVLAAAVTAAWNLPSLWFAGARPAPRLSIVVLPFANLGGDPGQQYFADGITDDLTTDLSRLADMLVISRDTAFTYKEKPVSAKRIGRELGVRYVLEGSVQRSANQVRINAQLIDAETDMHLWARRRLWPQRRFAARRRRTGRSPQVKWEWVAREYRRGADRQCQGLYRAGDPGPARNHLSYRPAPGRSVGRMTRAPAYAPILGSADVSNRQSAFPPDNHPIGLAVSIWDCRTFSR